MKNDYDVSSWDDFDVPGSWEMQGYSVPIYLDEEYPFPPEPPFVPHEYNRVGSYRRNFNLPSTWLNRDIFIQFNGVRSAFYLWINGKSIGYSQDSKTPAEFNITDFIVAGENSVSLEVYRFSDGSYLEGQDTWRISGIERSVFISAKPKIRATDFSVKSDLDSLYKDGHFELFIRSITKSKWPALYKLSKSDFTEKSVALIFGLAEMKTLRSIPLILQVSCPSRYEPSENLYTSKETEFSPATMKSVILNSAGVFES
jgi:beta-galactosidase